MSFPIGVSYTPAQMQELQQIWENLPNALQDNDQATLNADAQALQSLMNSFPAGSPQWQAMNYVNVLMGRLNETSEQYIEQVLAVQMYPQLPNVLNEQQAGQLQTLQQLMNDPTPSNLQEAQMLIGQLQQEIGSVQPPTPQATAILVALSVTSQNLVAYNATRSDPSAAQLYLNGAISSTTFILK